MNYLRTLHRVAAALGLLIVLRTCVETGTERGSLTYDDGARLRFYGAAFVSVRLVPRPPPPSAPVSTQVLSVLCVTRTSGRSQGTAVSTAAPPVAVPKDITYKKSWISITPQEPPGRTYRADDEFEVTVELILPGFYRQEVKRSSRSLVSAFARTLPG